MKAKLSSLMAVLVLTACGSLGGIAESGEAELAFLIVTPKLIRESDNITASHVIGFVQRARAVAAVRSGSVDVVIEALRSEIPWDDMLPEDRLIAQYLFDRAEVRIRERVGSTEDVQTSVTTILDTIERAAMFAGEN